MNAAAALVWQERFAPHVKKLEDLWLVSECITNIAHVTYETRWEGEQQDTAGVVAMMRFSNFGGERLLKRIADFVRAENPERSQEEIRLISEATYALHLRTDTVKELQAKKWTRSTKNGINALIRNHHPVQNAAPTTPSTSGEAVALAQKLRELTIPEFTALDTLRQIRVAARMIQERNEDAESLGDLRSSCQAPLFAIRSLPIRTSERGAQHLIHGRAVDRVFRTSA